MEIKYLSAQNRQFIWTPCALMGKDLQKHRNMLLEIRGGRIVSLQKISPAELEANPTRFPNLYRLPEGSTLMPSLVDAHVHLALSANGQNNEKNIADIAPEARDITTRFMKNGIGAVRDGGDRDNYNGRVRDIVAAENADDMEKTEKEEDAKDDDGLGQFRILSPGWALRKNKKYGSFLGEGYSNREELANKLATLVEGGMDHIKVIVSGIVSFKAYGKVGSLAMSTHDLKYVSHFAREQGLKVMAHANSPEAAEMAINAGVDSIEHGYFITAEQLEKMGEKQIAWVPTIIPVAVQLHHPQRENWEKAEREVISRTYREHIDKLKLALDKGVPLGIGTDSGASGVIHGDFLLEEMELYRQGKLNNREILKAATIVNARILGLAETRGSLEEGKSVSFIGVRGDPLQDLSVLRQINYFFLSC